MPTSLVQFFAHTVADRREAWPLLVLLVALLFGGGNAAEAQSPRRYGGGLQMMGSTVVESVGPGFHTRVSVPLNRDLSWAFGAAFSGFLFRGGDDAAYALTPSASLIVTLPDPSDSAPYLLGGLGGHVPLGGPQYKDVGLGPTFHLGLGKVWVQQTTSLYVELTPTLFFRRDRTDLLLPLRGGIIF